MSSNLTPKEIFEQKVIPSMEKVVQDTLDKLDDCPLEDQEAVYLTRKLHEMLEVFKNTQDFFSLGCIGIACSLMSLYGDKELSFQDYLINNKMDELQYEAESPSPHADQRLYLYLQIQALEELTSDTNDRDDLTDLPEERAQ